MTSTMMGKKLLPESFRKYPMFDNIYQLDCVPIATVQLRFDGWVTEMQDMEKMVQVHGDLSDGRAPGWTGGGNGGPDGVCHGDTKGNNASGPTQSGACDCGVGVACGEYLFDHRNEYLYLLLVFHQN